MNLQFLWFELTRNLPYFLHILKFSSYWQNYTVKSHQNISVLRVPLLLRRDFQEKSILIKSTSTWTSSFNAVSCRWPRSIAAASKAHHKYSTKPRNSSLHEFGIRMRNRAVKKVILQSSSNQPHRAITLGRRRRWEVLFALSMLHPETTLTWTFPTTSSWARIIRVFWCSVSVCCFLWFAIPISFQLN